jgi:threonine/homoserine/homoserine lactone efflux protein
MFGVHPMLGMLIGTVVADVPFVLALFVGLSAQLATYTMLTDR